MNFVTECNSPDRGIAQKNINICIVKKTKNSGWPIEVQIDMVLFSFVAAASQHTVNCTINLASISFNSFQQRGWNCTGFLSIPN
jgi:hypothetical protein